MKKIFLILGVVIVLALAYFFYPKEVFTGAGFAYPGMVYNEHKCFGFGSYKNIPDATILKCYGIPYVADTKIWQ